MTSVTVRGDRRHTVFASAGDRHAKPIAYTENGRVKRSDIP